MAITLKRVARGLCPPALWHAARGGYRRVRPWRAPPSDPRRRVSSLEALDAELGRARAARGESYDAFFAALDGFAFDPPADLPADPGSPAYRERQMEFYRRVSGRDRYRAATCEQMALDADTRHRPFPYHTRSSTVVGEQLMAVGFLVRALALPPAARVLEFGCGCGLLTLELARADFGVTAVDINPEYVELVRTRAAREALNVEAACAEMLDYRPAGRFDRVVFYESFHHCADHEAMVARLDSLVRPGGAAVFAGEPITDEFPMPWGVRPDGRSLWVMRNFGWLELGFHTDYFLDLLACHGWRASVIASTDVPWQRVFVARRATELE